MGRQQQLTRSSLSANNISPTTSARRRCISSTRSQKARRASSSNASSPAFIPNSSKVNMLNTFRYSLPDAIQSQVTATLAEWNDASKVNRIWQKDARVWTNEDEAK